MWTRKKRQPKYHELELVVEQLRRLGITAEAVDALYRRRQLGDTTYAEKQLAMATAPTRDEEDEYLTQIIVAAVAIAFDSNFMRRMWEMPLTELVKIAYPDSPWE